MVDVSAKAATERDRGRRRPRHDAPATLDLVRKGNAKKGDVLGAARIAGIMAAKRTHELIPLCHPLALPRSRSTSSRTASCRVSIVRATVQVTGQTGVEMEALTAVSVACLTIYDMVKAVDRGMRIEGIRLIEKSGGKSGHYRAKELSRGAIPVADALARVLDGCRAAAGRNVPLAEALGRVLAQTLTAMRTQPPADVSAMDGYAVRAADVANAPARLNVIGEVAAGRPFRRKCRRRRSGPHLYRRRHAARRRHDRHPGKHQARRRSRHRQRPPQAGRHIRRAGPRLRAGRYAAAAATGSPSATSTLAAAMNHATVPVHRRQSRCSHRRRAGAAGREPGRARSSIRTAMRSRRLRAPKAPRSIDLGIVAAISSMTPIAAVRRAREADADFCVTTGGASVGDYDLVQKALAAEGMDCRSGRSRCGPDGR